jgi:hypothetical protein
MGQHLSFDGTRFFQHVLTKLASFEKWWQADVNDSHGCNALRYRRQYSISAYAE